MMNNNDINLKEVFAELQIEFGNDILYVRANKYIRCQCYNVLHQCGDPECPYCLGLGHIASIERINMVNDDSTPGSLTPTIQGLVYTSDSKLLSMESSHTKVRDYILITTWDSNGYPVDIQGVFEVCDVVPIRDTNGGTMYCINFVKQRADMTLSANRYIKALSVNAKSTLSKGGTCIWPVAVQ